jgi:hypothetical protein
VKPVICEQAVARLGRRALSEVATAAQPETILGMAADDGTPASAIIEAPVVDAQRMLGSRCAGKRRSNALPSSPLSRSK